MLVPLLPSVVVDPVQSVDRYSRNDENWPKSKTSPKAVGSASIPESKEPMTTSDADDDEPNLTKRSARNDAFARQVEARKAANAVEAITFDEPQTIIMSHASFMLSRPIIVSPCMYTRAP